MTVWTMKEFMAEWKISRVKAYELANRPDFPSSRIGKKIVIRAEEAEAWLAAGGTDQREGA